MKHSLSLDNSIFVIRRSMYFHAIFAQESDVCFPICDETKESNKFLDKVGSFDSVEKTITLSMTKFDLFFPPCQKVDIDIADCGEILGREHSPINGDMEPVEMHNDSLPCKSE